MFNVKLSAPEKIIIVVVILIFAIGLLLFYTDILLFEKYIQEDGIAEWLTVAGLLFASFVCFSRVKKLITKKSKWFLFVTLCFGLFLVFAAGEEISWGQRLLNIETPAYFQQHNAQHETNLHNLVVSGVKINKLIFSFMLIGLLALYLVLVPVLYQKRKAAKVFLDANAVPVPQAYQVFGFLIVFVLTALIPHGKNAELLECGGALLFFLIVCYPKNKNIFTAA